LPVTIGQTAKIKLQATNTSFSAFSKPFSIILNGSVNEDLVNARCAMYPNPAKGTVQLMISNPDEVKSVVITDVTGRSVSSLSEVVVSNTIHLPQSGVYYIHIIGLQHRQVLKIISIQ